jgi:hypothetical protein
MNPTIPQVVLRTRDYPWESDDRDWFKHNPARSHRARMPFSGELDEETVKKAPAGFVVIMLVRQIAPGNRIRAAVARNVDAPPVPDDEAAIHALFEVMMGREPMPRDRQSKIALIEKYSMHRGAVQ